MIFNKSVLSDAFRAKCPNNLLRTQARAVGLILKRFADITQEALRYKSHHLEEVGSGRDGVRPHDVIRPHNVFSIDGARGSGKTYTLLTLADTIQILSDFWAASGRPALPDTMPWYDFLRSNIGKETLDALIDLRRMSSHTGLAQVLRIVFPGDMDGRESVMEAIFASMMAALEDTARDQHQATARRATELCNQLRTDVAQGWYFSKNLGHDSIVRDSIDYTDYVQKLEAETRKAATRIDAWRHFINDYLDLYHVATLVIMLDDSDVRPELTHDILHSIRMFLNHPRLFTVLAGNIRAMRSILIHQAMRPLGQAMIALSDPSGRTAQDWRRTERKAVEDYLEKVLPLAHRFFVRQASLREETVHDSSTSEVNSDFKKIMTATLSNVCTEMLRCTREDFLAEKFRLAVAHASGLSDAPGEVARQALEAFLAWWLFSDRYASYLAPKSARQIVTFRNYYLDFITSNSNNIPPGPKPKRLIIALFENPANYALIQQFNDEDANVVTWLHHQSLQSSWVGERQFQVNTRILTHSQYSYNYIRFRVDVGLATPVHHNAEAVVPRELLPEPKGRRYMRRFFQPREMPRRQKRHGVARWIDHAAIPGNCLYLYDLECLPEASFTPLPSKESASITELQSGTWEAKLAYDWIEVIEDGQDEDTYRYFTEAVCPSQCRTAEVPSTKLIELLNPRSLEREKNEAFYEVFWKDEFASFAEEEKDYYADLWMNNSTGANDKKTEEERRRMRRRVAVYAALITDLRRAWHAIRIYEHSPLKTDALIPELTGNAPSVSSEDERASFTVIATQDRLRLYTRKQIEQLFKGWTANLLQIFSSENIKSIIGTCTNDAVFDPFSSLYSAKGSDSEVEDHHDFEKWQITLSSLGWSTCERWPLCGDVTREYNERLKFFEKNLFEFSAPPTRPSESPIDYRLSIFDDEKFPYNDRQTNREHARAARNFVWLLYGLAPSLPAVIHTHIMGIVYHAELLIHNMHISNSHIPKTLLDEATRLYRDSRDEIDKWAELIGRLSALLRYVWTKYLWLHLSLALEVIRKSYKDGTLSPEKSAANFLRHNGHPEDQISVFEDMEKQFVGDNSGKLAKDLAIMPDMASATLFGEHWLSDMLNELQHEGKIAFPKPKPENVESDGSSRASIKSFAQIDGIFAETEMWLWATNRFLRKLRGQVNEQLTNYEQPQETT